MYGYVTIILHVLVIVVVCKFTASQFKIYRIDNFASHFSNDGWLYSF